MRLTYSLHRVSFAFREHEETTMTRSKIISLLPGLCLAGSFAVAQHVEAPERYTYATYLKCDTSNEGVADEFVAKYEA